MTTTAETARVLLAPYWRTNAVRLALILQEVGADTVPRPVVRQRWAELWPHHIRRDRIIHKISDALRNLGRAGLITWDASTITVVDRARVAIAASNADAVMDDAGHSVRTPRRLPTVPAELAAFQAAGYAQPSRVNLDPGKQQQFDALLLRYARRGPGGGPSMCASARFGRPRIVFATLADADDYAAGAGQIFGVPQRAYLCSTARDGHAHVRAAAPAGTRP